MKFHFLHENFNVLDLEKSIKFYEEALGLKVEREKFAEDGSYKICLLYTSKNFIRNPLIENEQKKAVLTEIFGKDSSENLNILLYILDKGRINCIKYIVAEYLKIYYRKNRILDVKATFTKELSEEQRTKLINKLSQKTGKELSLIHI